MSGPALDYLEISREVGEIVRRYSGNDRSRACYMVARAAILIIRGERGSKAAAMMARDIATELLFSCETPTPLERFPESCGLIRTATQRPKGTPLERVLRRVDVQPGTGCWLWTGALLQSGYGSIGISASRGQGVVHRVTYEAAFGPIAPTFVVDHLCRNRRCCNPDHLEAVEEAVNIRRGNGGRFWSERTHCKYGHELTPDNNYGTVSNRVCKACARRRNSLHGHVTPFIRRKVFDRDGGVCRYCEALVEWADYHCDHMVPLARGGARGLSNLVCSCSRCNRRKGARTADEFLADEMTGPGA